MMIPWAACSITGATAAFVVNDGSFASCTGGGGAGGGVIGTWTLTLVQSKAVASTQCVIKVQHRGTQPGALGVLAVSFGCLQTTTTTVKTINALLEPAGGGPSAAANVDFDVMIWRIVP